MNANPFRKDSPILHLYYKSRSKSQSNRTPVASKLKSYREFQVKMISNALDRQHVIQKEYNG